jgi:4-hydroxymandelate oxidase
MGGVNNSRNFLLNCAYWKILRDKVEAAGKLSELKAVPVDTGVLSIGPVTGAEQNVGYAHESDFYLPYFTAAYTAGTGICVGDGCPDEKLRLGLAAVRSLQEQDKSLRAGIFLKPYPNGSLFERIEWCEGTAGIIGCDIDSYNIVTMRNSVNLEKKTPQSIAELRSHIHVPFALKGIFTREDIELVKQTLPDIVVISNHGGRVDTREGSTAEFLAGYGKKLKKYCGELWVDGGIRSKADIQTALYYGASHVLAARPFIAALVKNGTGAAVESIRSIINQ